MTEADARRVFHDMLALCDVLGRDVREACIEAGVPAAMLDRIMRDHAAATAATTRCIMDPAVMPVTGPAPRRGRGQQPGFLCLGQKLTGLPMIVWVMQSTAANGSPYLRVQCDHSPAPRADGSARVSLEVPAAQIDGPPMAPADFLPLAAFIRTNRGALLEHWNRGASTMRLLRRLVPLR